MMINKDVNDSDLGSVNLSENDSFWENEIKKIIQSEFKPSIFKIRNLSERHFGHAGFDERGSHFEIEISSSKFNELTRIQSHRLVNDSLKTCFAQGLHSVVIKIIR